jgi:hypothetical protein
MEIIVYGLLAFAGLFVCGFIIGLIRVLRIPGLWRRFWSKENF